MFPDVCSSQKVPEKYLQRVHTIKSELSKAFGLHSVTLNKPSSLESDLSEFLQHEGAGICVIKLVRNETLAPKVAAVPQKNGSIISMPLEDMTPLLDIDTLSSEMIYPLSPDSLKAREIN